MAAFLILYKINMPFQKLHYECIQKKLLARIEVVQVAAIRKGGNQR